MNRERLEVRRITEWLENGATQRRAEVNLSDRAIAEPKPHDVSGNVPGLYNVIIQ